MQFCAFKRRTVGKEGDKKLHSFFYLSKNKEREREREREALEKNWGLSQTKSLHME